VLLLSGNALSCGCNEEGQLGWAPPPPDVSDADDEPEVDTSELAPLALPVTLEKSLVQISCSALHGAAVSCDGRVVTWGSARDGRLGRVAKGRGGGGVAEGALARPAAVAVPEADQNIVSVACGGAHTVAVSAGGWCALLRVCPCFAPPRRRAEMRRAVPLRVAGCGCGARWGVTPCTRCPHACVAKCSAAATSFAHALANGRRSSWPSRRPPRTTKRASDLTDEGGLMTEDHGRFERGRPVYLGRANLKEIT
jgi:hypothetical protein